jgi:Fic-DOC domain mobile mystery protein B
VNAPPLTGAHAPAATPLTAEDLEGLKILSVTTREDLNEAEANNIVKGQDWALRSRLVRLPSMLSDNFMQRLHREMFGEVWHWAGRYRIHDTNIGVADNLIRQSLRQVYDDARAWLQYKTYTSEELAVRLHYRIVSVHPFHNGNGRHARMIADLVLIRHFKADPLLWGGGALRLPDETRQNYIDALRAADHHDFAPLLTFARSNG